jgi:hypothetical protein
VCSFCIQHSTFGWLPLKKKNARRALKEIGLSASGFCSKEQFQPRHFDLKRRYLNASCSSRTVSIAPRRKKHNGELSTKLFTEIELSKTIATMQRSESDRAFFHRLDGRKFRSVAESA